MHIARLREKLHDDPADARESCVTVRGQGYMLAGSEVVMKRLGAVWLIFGLCVALAAGAMARVGIDRPCARAGRGEGPPPGRARRERCNWRSGGWTRPSPR